MEVGIDNLDSKVGLLLESVSELRKVLKELDRCKVGFEKKHIVDKRVEEFDSVAGIVVVVG